MAEIGIFVGTMYGNSLLVAEEAEAILTAQGHKATVFEDPELSDWLPIRISMFWWLRPRPGRATFLIALCRSFRELKIPWASSRICVMA